MRPGGSLATWLRQHSLLGFVLLTFGITWSLGAAFALFPAQLTAIFGELSFSNPLIIVAVCAPSVSGLVMTAVTGGARGIRALLTRCVQWQVGVRWYAAVLIGVPVLSGIATLLNAALSTSPLVMSDWSDLVLRGPSGVHVIQLVSDSRAGWLFVVRRSSSIS